MSRLVSTLSLDGDRISADIVVHFQRALSSATSESVADEIAKAATEILGDQISQGEVPLSKEELVNRVRGKISASAAKITEVEVKALYVFGSEVNANKSTYRARHASPPPPAAGPSHRSGAVPSVRQSSSFPASALTPPPSPRVRTLWPHALESCEQGTSAADVGVLLGPPLRDSVAAAILHSFVAIDPEAADRLELFGAAGAVDSILLEVCACFSSAAYRIFVSSGLEAKFASEIVRAAAAQVLTTQDFPAEQVSHYMASDSPVRDLASRVATAIDASDTAAAIQAAVYPYCEALRDDLLSVAAQLRQLIV